MTDRTSSQRLRWTAARLTGLVVAVGLAVAVVGTVAPISQPAAADAAPGATWLEAVNQYRAMAHLAPVVEEPSWSAGLAAHLTYLDKTPAAMLAGSYASAHTENPASPWYTADGAAAGASADLALGHLPSDTTAIDDWMAAPFHAVGILRSQLQRVAFVSSGSGAALDVIRGISGAPAGQPVLWPGDGSYVGLTQSINELPSPLESCPGYAEPAGLPILALLPSDPPAGTTAQLHLPSGLTLTQGPDLCVITAATYHSSNAVYGAAGQSIMKGDHVVVIVPRSPLVVGTYGVDLVRPGQAPISWSFTETGVPAAALAAGATPTGSPDYEPIVPQRVLDTRAGVGATPGKIGAGQTVRVAIGGRAVPLGTAAVVLNVTVTEPDASGYVSVFPCGSAPDASNLNYVAGQTVANLTAVALDGSGGVCLNTMAGAHLIADVNGYFGPGAGFHGTRPTRLLDTRSGVGAPAQPVPAGGVVQLQVVGRSEAAVPAGAGAVVLNVTATNADEAGYVTVWPCGTPQPTASNLNVTAGATVPNLVVAELGTDGTVCLASMGRVDLVADLDGWLSGGGPYRAVDPERLLDTRSGVGAAPGVVSTGQTIQLQVTGRGRADLPATASAVVLNVTATEAGNPGYVTVWPCGTARPTASNLNLRTGDTAANLAIAKVGAGGTVCLFTTSSAHLVADLEGWFA